MKADKPRVILQGVSTATGVSADIGGDTIEGRDTLVGVEAGFGKIRIGKMDTLFKKMGGLTDRLKGTGIQDEGSVALLGGSGHGFGRRQNNSVRYDAPAFGHSFGHVAGQIQYGLARRLLAQCAGHCHQQTT